MPWEDEYGLLPGRGAPGRDMPCWEAKGLLPGRGPPDAAGRAGRRLRRSNEPRAVVFTAGKAMPPGMKEVGA